MSASWYGSTANTRTQNQPRYSFSASENKLIIVEEGVFDNLLSIRPTIGSTLSGFSGYFIERVEVNKMEGGKGQMTIGLFQNISGGAATTPSGADAIYEIDWCQVEKRLEQHPRYRVGAAGAKVLTTSDLSSIEDWKSTTDATERDTKRAALTANAQDFVSKLEKGQDSYLIYIPVLRKTSTTYTPPSTSTCGKRETPPGFPAVPSGYTFLKTADRGQRTGQNRKWERQEEWTGFDFVDPDIYTT
jgi:hypothetical protein